jgi:sugar lactone lactonase YvrE
MPFPIVNVRGGAVASRCVWLAAVLWGAAIAAGPGAVLAQDMDLSGVLVDGEGWTLVGEGYKFTEGPAADRSGAVYFTDVSGDRIHKAELDGSVKVVVSGAGKPSGLKFGPKGLLYCAQYEKQRIVTYDVMAADVGMSEKVVADGIPVNDLAVTSSGWVFVTAPAKKQVVSISPEGVVAVAAEGIVTNGATLWSDEGTLVVTEGNEPILWTFRLARDGKLSDRDRYYGPLQVPAGKDKPGSDGMAVDTKGRLYVATHAGLQIFDPTGRHAGTIVKPQNAFLSNVCFGGADRRTLYVTSTDKVYKRKVQAEGLPWTN